MWLPRAGAQLTHNPRARARTRPGSSRAHGQIYSCLGLLIPTHARALEPASTKAPGPRLSLLRTGTYMSGPCLGLACLAVSYTHTGCTFAIHQPVRVYGRRRERWREKNAQRPRDTHLYNPECACARLASSPLPPALCLFFGGYYTLRMHARWLLDFSDAFSRNSDNYWRAACCVSGDNPSEISGKFQLGR